MRASMSFNGHSFPMPRHLGDISDAATKPCPPPPVRIGQRARPLGFRKTCDSVTGPTGLAANRKRMALRSFKSFLTPYISI